MTVEEITICGYSDDIIRVRGKELDANDMWIEFSTGDKVYVTYTEDGTWLVDHVNRVSESTHTPCRRPPNEEEDENYSDVLVLKVSPTTKCWAWTDDKQGRVPSDDELEEVFLDRMDKVMSTLTPEQKIELWRAMHEVG